MQMNHYLWSLYLQAGGQAIVERFAAFETGDREKFAAFIRSLMQAYCPDAALIDDVAIDIDDAISVLNESEEISKNEELSADKDSNLRNNPDYYEQVANNLWQTLRESLYNEVQDIRKVNDKEIFHVFCDNIVYFSVLDYAESPDMIPYFFPRLYNVLSSIAETFEIKLPELPSRRAYKDRFALYYNLNAILKAYREEQSWSPAELCAFLYDFAPKFVGGTNWIWSKLPEPSAAFVIGAPPDADEWLSRGCKENSFAWQGNPETQPGDVILLYQWTPTSAFTSIWQATAPGFIDPLFWYYRCIYFGRPVYVQPLTFRELRDDPILGKIPLVKTKMQGMNGTALKPSEYNRVLECLDSKGNDTSFLPKLTEHYTAADAEIRIERDVEKQLLEPLLERLGWTRAQYVRQMPLRMGRGSTVYPDYVILPQFTPNYEKGYWIVEAKKSISNDKQLHVDFGQAISYAYRLNASGIMLVAQEGIWLSEKTTDFKKNSYYTWEQMQEDDLFLQVYKVCGNRRRKGIP